MAAGLKRALNRYGGNTSNAYRAIRDPLWSGSSFRVHAAIDTRGICAEVSNAFSQVDASDSIFVAGVSFQHDDKRARHFSADGKTVEAADIPKTRKLPLTLDFVKGLSRRYALSVCRMDIVRADLSDGFYKVGYGMPRDGERELLIFSIQDQFGATVLCDDEAIRCEQGSLWRLPGCRALRVRPVAGRCVHALFDVVPIK